MNRSVIATAVAIALGTATLAVAQHEGHGDHGTSGQKVATTAPSTGPTTKKVAVGKPINQFCPINTDEKVDPKVTTVYKGKVIGFCCADCIETFNKDPEKYMKTLK
jgi:YHS domain-containing protein